MAQSSKIWFDVILRPHRSLSPHGFVILMYLLSAISFTVGLLFLLMGAWPVFGFFGLDVLAVYLAFRLNYRAGEVAETIKLTDDELLVQRMTPRDPPAEWRFQPYWVRVQVDNLNEYQSEMVLTSHGERLRIGDFLNQEEIRDLAAALKDALMRQRSGIATQNM